MASEEIIKDRKKYYILKKSIIALFFLFNSEFLVFAILLIVYPVEGK